MFFYQTLSVMFLPSHNKIIKLMIGLIPSRRSKRMMENLVRQDDIVVATACISYRVLLLSNEN